MTRTQDTPDLSGLLMRAELDAERLVSLLRILVALGLGVFLWGVVSPPEESSAGVINILKRQWVFAAGTVGAYLLLGVITYVLSRRGLMRIWMIWITATADALFIVLSVWTSMQNTGLMGDAVFLMPSIWLVPIVLSFAVLRANPAVTAYTVALLTAGVGLLISVEAGQLPQTETSAVWMFLSPPPNLMRLVMIALAGLLLYVAARRTRRLLRNSIGAALRTANLTRYLPRQLAPRLAEGGLEQLRKGHRHAAGILFIDMRGFTTWAETRTPQEVTALMSAYRDRIALVADRHGGLIDKFVGDAAMIVFEAEESPSVAARNCVACAMALIQSMETWSQERHDRGEPPIRVGVGAHWGDVFSGVVGHSARLEYSVFGDTVNTAARLEQMTKTADMAVVLSGALLDAAGEETRAWESLGDVSLRGKSHGLTLYGRRSRGR